ncbi:phage tail protein [Pseudomonas gingeri]|nr:phage tail protein [Pseudomonas gingeri]
MPADVVLISEELYLSVLGNPPPGKMRAHEENGMPYLIDAPSLEPDIEAKERAWRDSELSSCIWMRDRHRDQLEIGTAPELTDEQYRELLIYMQALRDWPQSPLFPEPSEGPSAPSWFKPKQEIDQ